MVYQDKTRGPGSGSHAHVGEPWTGVCPKCNGETELVWLPIGSKVRGYRCKRGHYEDGKDTISRTVYLVDVETDKELVKEIEKIVGIPCETLTEKQLEKHILGLINEGKLREEDFT